MNKGKAEQICAEWTQLIGAGDPGILAVPVEYGGDWYVVSRGTGEGCFAYDADEVGEWLETADPDCGLATYEDFCDSVSVYSSIGLAVEVYRQTEIYICEPGSCLPVEFEEA